MSTTPPPPSHRRGRGPERNDRPLAEPVSQSPDGIGGQAPLPKSSHGDASAAAARRRRRKTASRAWKPPVVAEMNLVELIDRFGDEDRCYSYLEALRWPDGVTCPRCQSARIKHI